jgi:hypothetical protein
MSAGHLLLFRFVGLVVEDDYPWIGRIKSEHLEELKVPIKGYGPGTTLQLGKVNLRMGRRCLPAKMRNELVYRIGPFSVYPDSGITPGALKW